MSKLTESFYTFRTNIWTYPDIVFLGKRSWKNSFIGFYKASLPFSHFVSVILLCVIFFLYGTANLLSVLSINNNTLIEGTVMGADADGNPVRLNRINPLLNSNVQLERDLSELIYEPLLRVDSEGTPHSVLAEFSMLEQGKSIRFKLKENVKWHDGSDVTVADVVRTVELIRSLDKNSQTSSLFSKVANKFDIITSENDSRVFEFVVKNDQIIPGFFEAISFKIMPAHLLTDIDENNITQPDPYINRTPIGTGPYKMIAAKEDTVDLALNQNYWGNKPTIKNIRFKLFPSESTAIQALGAGQIHGLASIAISNLDQVKNYSSIDIVRSNYIYNQYWALYLNMGENGPAPLKDMKVRQAISSAINRDDIVTGMQGLAAVSKGPIPPNSFAYYQAEKYSFNQTKAIALLEEAGYKAGDDGIRTKEGKRLSFELLYINNQDRQATAESIKANLKVIGIEVNIKSMDLSAAVDDHILPRMYDLLLYGVQTLIDPDRFELFNSTQIAAPGLNIASYISTEKRTQVVDGKTTKVPAVDDDLNDARRIVDEKARAKKYEDFQKIIAEEVPVVFLFYPEEFYLINKRVNNVALEDITSIEQRFNSIYEWEIYVD